MTYKEFVDKYRLERKDGVLINERLNIVASSHLSKHGDIWIQVNNNKFRLDPQDENFENILDAIDASIPAKTVREAILHEKTLDIMVKIHVYNELKGQKKSTEDIISAYKDTLGMLYCDLNTRVDIEDRKRNALLFLKVFGLDIKSRTYKLKDIHQLLESLVLDGYKTPNGLLRAFLKEHNITVG